MGKNLIFVPECHSTNSLALNLNQQSPVADGTVVITNHQNAGRGQRGSSWEAEPGKNLTFSIVVKPVFLSIRDQFFLNIFSSLAVYDFLKGETDAAVSIKWPNDVLANGKKLCGILVENQILGSQVSSSVVGIGLNVNQTNFSVASAGSLYQIVGDELALPTVLEELLGCLEARYLQLRQGNFTLLKENYLNAMYWRNEKHMFTAQGMPLEGTITGIDDLGKLTMETSEGLRSFDIKEIAFVQ